MEDDTKYVRVDPRDHILLRPDLYVGSIVKVKEEQFVLVDGPKIEKKVVTYVPAFLKIFDEVSQSFRKTILDVTFSFVTVFVTFSFVTCTYLTCTFVTSFSSIVSSFG